MGSFKVCNSKHLYMLFTAIVFLFYIITSLKIMFFSGRMCWEDEAHFWTIVQNLSITEIFELMKYEGHMLLWFLIVMPFAKLNFTYPYPMQILNWIFCTLSLAIMWKKSPFNIVIKTAIVASPVFLLYASHARCYAIGVLFLFLACTFYKQRLKHPYLYFFILFLAANTNIQALFGASSIGIVFLYDLYRESQLKKAAIVVTILTILTGIIYYFQFSGSCVPDYEIISKHWRTIINPFVMFWGQTEILKIYSLSVWFFRITLVMMFFAFITRPKALIVYVFSMLSCSLFFLNIYLPREWHICFFFIYLIISYWIFLEENPPTKIKHYSIFVMYFILVYTIAAIHIIPPFGNPVILNAISESEELKQGKIYSDINPIHLSVALPYLNNQNVYIYDMKGRKLNEFEALKATYNRNEKAFKYDEFIKSLDREKQNYLITQTPLENRKEFENFKFFLLKQNNSPKFNYYIYLINSHSQNKADL